MSKFQETKSTIKAAQTGTGELGFTLIELLIASVLALILMLTTTTIIFQALEFADRQRLRPLLNEKARQTFDLLGDGGCCSTQIVPGVSRPPRLSGMRDRGSFSPASASDLRHTELGNEYRLQLDVGSDDRYSFTPIGPETSGISINCRGEDDPIQGCSANTTKTVRGYLAWDPRVFLTGNTNSQDRSIDDNQRGLQNRTIEVEYLLIQPHQANRTRFRSGEIRESYRTIYTFNQSQ